MRRKRVSGREPPAASARRVISSSCAVKEGEKTRVITVTFNESGGAAASTDGGAPSSPEPDHAVRPASNGGGPSVFPWLVVGAGVATVITGVVVLASSPALPAGCNAVTKTCARDATESAAASSDRRGSLQITPWSSRTAAGASLTTSF